MCSCRLYNGQYNSSSTSPGDDKEPFHSSTGELSLSDVDVTPVDFNDDDSISVPAAQLPPDHQSTTTQDPPLVVPRRTVHVGSCNPDKEEAVTPMDKSITAVVELMHILIENLCHLKMLPQIMK